MRASVILQSETMDIVAFVTAPKRSLRRLCFYICLPFCPWWGGGIPEYIAGGIPACLAGLRGVVCQHALQVSRSTPKGEVEGSGLGGGLQAHT